MACMEQPFVTRRFVAAVLLLAGLQLLASPPTGPLPAVAGALLAAATAAAVYAGIVKALYLGARRLVAGAGWRS